MSLEVDIFGLKTIVKSGIKFLNFDFQRAPSKIPARPIQPFWEDLFTLGSSKSEGAQWISKQKNSSPLFIIIFRPEMLKFHPYSILTGQTMVRFVKYCVLSYSNNTVMKRYWTKLSKFLTKVVTMSFPMKRSRIYVKLLVKRTLTRQSRKPSKRLTLMEMAQSTLRSLKLKFYPAQYGL